jgi:integrase
MPELKVPSLQHLARNYRDVPLSRQAIAVLKDIWPLSDHGELIFPSVRSNRKPLSENAFNSALRRMGYAKDEMTAHGFRSSGSTILNGRASIRMWSKASAQLLHMPIEPRRYF